MTTILQPADIRALVLMKDDLCRFPTDLYLIAATARPQCPDLETSCFEVADLLTVARVKLDKAILLAAAERGEK